MISLLHRVPQVWNLELVSQTQSLDPHGSWIRALATEKDVLCSASKDNTVKVRSRQPDRNARVYGC